MIFKKLKNREGLDDRETILLQKLRRQRLRTLRAPNLQLAVELTDAGRGIAEPLYQEEREAETARQRLTDVWRLPSRKII